MGAAEGGRVGGKEEGGAGKGGGCALLEPPLSPPFPSPEGRAEPRRLPAPNPRAAASHGSGLQRPARAEGLPHSPRLSSRLQPLERPPRPRFRLSPVEGKAGRVPVGPGMEETGGAGKRVEPPRRSLRQEPAGVLRSWSRSASRLWARQSGEGWSAGPGLGGRDGTLGPGLGGGVSPRHQPRVPQTPASPRLRAAGKGPGQPGRGARVLAPDPDAGPWGPSDCGLHAARAWWVLAEQPRMESPARSPDPTAGSSLPGFAPIHSGHRKPPGR